MGQTIPHGAIAKKHENYPAANTAAVVTITPASGKRVVLRRVQVSISGTPAAGTVVTITVGGVTKFKQYVEKGGLSFSMLGGSVLAGNADDVVVVTVSAPGAAGQATLDVWEW